MLHTLYLISHPKIKNISNQTYYKLSETEYKKTVNSNNSENNPYFINTNNFPNLTITKF